MRERDSFGKFVSSGSLRQAFDRHFRVRNPAECWPWLGYSQRYGKLKHEGRRYSAHRLSYQLNVGEIPDGMHVCHHCDNPVCVNPNHLFVGTNGDNRLDSYLKGRTARGERNSHCKLSRSQVLEIRSSAESAKMLSQRFGISRSEVSLIKAGSSWGWL